MIEFESSARCDLSKIIKWPTQWTQKCYSFVCINMDYIAKAIIVPPFSFGLQNCRNTNQCGIASLVFGPKRNGVIKKMTWNYFLKKSEKENNF